MSIKFLDDFYSKNSILYHTDDSYSPAITYLLDGIEHCLFFNDSVDSGIIKSNDDTLSVKIECCETNGIFSLNIRVDNISNVDIKRVSLRLGINSYMCTYPEWNEQFFPTLLRCEKTHFYGYYSTPSGRILALSSPDKFVSWSHCYNEAIYGMERHVGHRIYTSYIDLINIAPQPAHHPDPCLLKAGQIKKVCLNFKIISTLDELSDFVKRTTCAPVVKLQKYTIEENETPKIECVENFALTNERNVNVDFCDVSSKCGRYMINASAEGKTTQTSLYVRKPWSWYLRKAAINAVNAPQKASTHMESWLGFFTRFYDLKYFPNHTKKKQLVSDFEATFKLMFDFETGTVYEQADPNRIQNISMAVSLLTLAYSTLNDEKYIVYASKLIDRIIESQSDDGAYRNGNTHYTCVSYLAKSLMEYYYIIRGLDGFKETADKCKQSIVLAIRNLVENEDNIQTEGQMTFEDGMISCEVLQLAMATLLFPKEFGRDTLALAEKLFDKHKCLQQRMIPDCRQRGGTIRFWEAMYDVIIPTNFINSPHGWTAWKVYATYYLYLLTGKKEYLIDTMDTLGACVQCIDLETGKLRWGFISDPSVNAKMFVNENGGCHKSAVIGEQYVDMVSDWWKSDTLVHGFANPEIGLTSGFYKGASCDNDIHEVFKCMCETVIDKAFIHFEDGKLICYNCSVDNGVVTLKDKFINQLLVFADAPLKLEYLGRKLKINNIGAVTKIKLIEGDEKVIGLICEPGYENLVWTKQQYDNLISEFRRRRIKYALLKEIEEACDFDDDEPMIIVALGTLKSWFKDIVDKCNMMGLRIITVGNYYPRTAEGNFSCVISDMRNSAIDIYKYFSAYDKNKVILYGVNPFSDFDSELERELLKLFDKDDICVIKKNGDSQYIINKFFEVCEGYNAVVCTNDYDAIELLQRIKVKNPDYLKNNFIVSFSNTLLSLLYSPSITTFYESATSSAKYTVKLYYMLLQNSDLNNINFHVKEKLKIRETTHYSPFVSEKAFNVSNSMENHSAITEHERSIDICQSETVNELRRIEDTLFSFDKIDFSILVLLFERKSTLEISKILYTSRGSVRYRMGRMLEKFGVNHREEMIDLVSRYLTPEALLKYSEEHLENN